MLIDAGGGTVDTITYTVFNNLTARRLPKWAAFVGRHRAFATPSSRKVTKREHKLQCESYCYITFDSPLSPSKYVLLQKPFYCTPTSLHLYYFPFHL